jgi:hypothetical protein
MSIHIRLLLTTSTIVLSALQQASAQPFEVFAGYTIGQMNPENKSNRSTMTGWNSSITFYPLYRWGITADLAGHYGTTSPTLVSDANGSTVSLSPVSTRQHSFMAGPQYRLFRRSRFETSIRALLGTARGHIPTTTYSVNDETTFTALLGSNFDLNVSRKMAVRFSTGLYLTQFGAGQTQTNFRFSVGPVFRFSGGE